MFKCLYTTRCLNIHFFPNNKFTDQVAIIIKLIRDEFFHIQINLIFRQNHKAFGFAWKRMRRLREIFRFFLPSYQRAIGNLKGNLPPQIMH